MQVRGTRDPLESRPVEAKLPAPAIHPSWVACLCDRVSCLPTPKPVELCAPGLVVRHTSYKYSRGKRQRSPRQFILAQRPGAGWSQCRRAAATTSYKASAHAEHNAAKLRLPPAKVAQEWQPIGFSIPQAAATMQLYCGTQRARMGQSGNSQCASPAGWQRQWG